MDAMTTLIELQEAHKNLLAIHAEDAYHLDEARAKLQAPAIDERAEFEKWWRHFENARNVSLFDVWQARAKVSASVVPEEMKSDLMGDYSDADIAGIESYTQGWNDCRTAMLKGEK